MLESQFDPNPKIKIAVVYHSNYGHTAQQAQAVVRGAQLVAGVEVSSISVDKVEQHWAELAAADAIIFGTPTYMGGPAAAFKAFMDASSAVWMNNLGWRNKLAAGFTNSQNMSGDKLNTLISLAIFAAQHGMQWVSLDLYGGWNTTTASIEELNRLGGWLGAMAQAYGDKPNLIESDLKTAEYLGKRVAILTQQWVRGQQTQTQLAATALA